MVSPSCLSAGSGLSDCWFSMSEFALVQFTQLFDERKAQADQPILVGQDEPPDRTHDDPIQQGQHLLALNVQSSANGFDPCIDD